jgi:hypothetical protein
MVPLRRKPSPNAIDGAASKLSQTSQNKSEPRVSSRTLRDR